jgi:hypothetical protein
MAGVRFLRVSLFIVGPILAAVLVLAPVAGRAGDMTTHKIGLAGPDNTLDGRVFSGDMGALGKATLNKDTWIFKNGTFMSMQCEKCGFPRGIYQTRRVGNKVHFVTETPCPRTDARIVWRGTIENGRIEGVYTWTRKRWYRTIVKKFWFKGTLDKPGQSQARVLTE